MHRRSLPALAGIALLVSALLAAVAAPAGADAATSAATDWLATQQQPDGGFEVAGFDGFESPDAILAIAEDAQTTGTWSAAEALAAVEAHTGGTDGASPLDWADDWADGLAATCTEAEDCDSGHAAKLLVLVLGPLGLLGDAGAFDPSADGATDLLAVRDAGEPPNGIFTDRLYWALSHVVTGDEVPDATVEAVRAAQEATGGWNFAGDPAGTGFDDIDTTSLALQLLAAVGVPPSDGTVQGGLAFLAQRQGTDGSWAESFSGVADTIATSRAVLGVEASGWDSTDRCWRDAAVPARAHLGAGDPLGWIRDQQLSSPPEHAGRFTSANDGFGVNTAATSQSVEALLRGWLPLAEGDVGPGPELTDVPPCAYYTQAVGWMEANELTTGFPDGTFRPASGMTRQALAAQLFRFLDPEFEAPAEATFPDVPLDHPFFTEIEWMASEGITTGYADGSFGPARAVTRGQAAVFLHRLVGEPEVADGAPTFPDVPESSFFAGPISWMADHRLTNPYPDGEFKAANPLNRGQLATFLHRLAGTEPAWGDVPLPPSVLFPAA